MRSEIPWLTLEEVVEDILDRRGVTPLKLGGDFTLEGHRVISAKLIKGGRVQLDADEARFINEHIYAKWMRVPLRRGDVIMTSEAPLGELAFLGEDVDWALGQRLFAIRPKADRLSGRFLYYALQTEKVRADILGRASGTTVQGIRQAELRLVRVPVPGLETQVEVSDLLGALDDRIDLLRQTNATLESIAQALFKSWFIDFDPVRAKAEGREPEGMDATTASLFPAEFEESEVGLLPKGWAAQPFGSLLAHAIGGDWGSESETADCSLPATIIRGTDIPDIGAGRYHAVPRRFVSPKKAVKRILQDGDLAIEVSGGSKTQPTGRSLYLSRDLLAKLGDTVVPTSFCRLFRARDSQTALVLARHLVHIYRIGKMWNYQVQSTGLANFQTQHFLDTEMVVVAPSVVFEKFFELVRPLVDRIHAAPIAELEAMRDVLLPRLISGKLRLPEVQAQLEETMA